VLDKRLIEGRTQEWNISRGELRVRNALMCGCECACVCMNASDVFCV